MRLKCVNKKISDYDFLRLFLMINVIMDGSPIIANSELEHKLYDYYDKEEYHFLFEDIAKKEDPSFPKYNKVDLNRAFQTGYTYGLISRLPGLRTMINYTKEEAIEFIKDYEEKSVNLVKNLYLEMQEEKENKVLIKKGATKNGKN